MGTQTAAWLKRVWRCAQQPARGIAAVGVALVVGLLGCAWVGGRLGSGEAVTPSAAPAVVIGQSFDFGSAELTVISRVQRAYFEQVNAAGGVRGSPIRLVALDDRGDLATLSNNLRTLGETHGAIAMLGMAGSLSDQQAAIPRLFGRDRLPAPARVGSAAAIVGFYPDDEMEGRLIAKTIADLYRAPRVGVLIGDDEASRRMLDGVRKGLGPRAADWISKVALVGTDAGSTETSLRDLQKSGATVLVVAIPSAIAVRAFATLKAIDWIPQSFVGTEVARTLQAASAAERATATEARSVRYLLDANDPNWSRRQPYHFEEFSRWDNHRGVQAYTRFVKSHVPGVDPKSEPVEFAYSTAQLLVQALLQCHGDPSREAVAKQALRLAGVTLPLLSPGIRIYTHPGRQTPITQAQPVRFDGARWVEFGDVIEAGE